MIANPHIVLCVRSLQQAFYELLSSVAFQPRESHVQFFTHVHRELNKQADSLATCGVLAFGEVKSGCWRNNRVPAQGFGGATRVWLCGPGLTADVVKGVLGLVAG